MNIEQYLYYSLYAVLYLFLAIIMKYILNFRTGHLYTADKEIAEGNMAVGLRRSGAQLGLAIAMLGVMSGTSTSNLWSDIISTASYGLLAVGFMLMSLLITDKAILPGVDNSDELKKGNMAVGMVEFGTLIMTGMLAYASIRGDEGGLLSSLIYFVAGQLTIILLVIAYEKILARKINPVRCVMESNLSAGIYLSGKIIAYGFILQSAIIGNGSVGSQSFSIQPLSIQALPIQPASIQSMAIDYILAAVMGMIMLYIFEILIDRLIVTSTKIKEIIEKDQQVAAIQLSFAKIGMSLILGMAIL